MEILDCFCGIGPWGHRDRLLPYKIEDTLALMDHCGIARALAAGNLALDGGWSDDGNAIAAEAARENNRFVPAFVLIPPTYDHSPSLDLQFEAMRQAGAKAVVLRSQMTPHLRGHWDWHIDGILEGCQARRLPVLFNCEGADLGHIDRMCGSFPELRMILTGLSYTTDDVLYPLMRRHRNLHACIGHMYIPENGIKRFVDHFSAERLLFGSGLPLFSPGALIGYVMYALVSDADKALILGGNLKRLLAEVAL